MFASEGAIDAANDAINGRTFFTDSSWYVPDYTPNKPKFFFNQNGLKQKLQQKYHTLKIGFRKSFNI